MREGGKAVYTNYIHIVNDHFKDSVKLTEHFKFKIDIWKYQNTFDLECEQPQQLFNYDDG
jgi:hypothetical protein